jgi:peptide/nickel transport system ATP-binding protein
MRVLPHGARVTGGRVILDGRDLTALSDEEMRQVRSHRIAIVPQDPMTAFDPLLSVGDQIAETIRAHEAVSSKAARARAVLMLDQVRLPDPERVARSIPSQLSGGMNQRALIAMALATNPVVLIADEPTTALDVTVQAQMLELLRELKEARGLAVLLVTHDMGVAGMVADRVAVMYAGRVVEVGPTRALFRRPRHPYTVALSQAVANVPSGRPGGSAIPGAPPNLLELPRGCAFAPRCAYVREECVVAVPKLRDFGETKARCVLDDRERPWLGPAMDRTFTHA